MVTSQTGSLPPYRYAAGHARLDADGIWVEIGGGAAYNKGGTGVAAKRSGTRRERCRVDACERVRYSGGMVKRKARPNAAKTGRTDPAPAAAARRPSALVDTRIIYCGDCLEQLAKFPDGCVDLIYIDPPFNSNGNYEVFWGETKEKRAFEDRHASMQAYIEYMRPRCSPRTPAMSASSSCPAAVHFRGVLSWGGFSEKRSR